MTIGAMFWRNSHRCWYAKVDGKFRRLSPCPEDAKQLYQGLMVEHGSKDPTVADAVCLYLDWVRRTKSPVTYRKSKRTLDMFAARYGTTKASQIAPKHLFAWADSAFPYAGATTVNDRLGAVMTAWRWLARQDRKFVSLIDKVERPSREMREWYLPKTEWPTLMKACSPSSRPIIEFMLRTGARPQEACRLTVEQWDSNHFQIRATLAKGKRRSRQIMVPTDVIPMVVDQIAGRKSGVVFLNSQGRAWTKDSLNCVFRRLKIKLKMPELCAYALRHSFAAERVSAGVHLEVVAKLMGHANTDQVYRRYGHLDKQTALLRAAIG